MEHSTTITVIAAILSSGGVLAAVKVVGDWIRRRQSSGHELRLLELRNRLDLASGVEPTPLAADGIMDTFRVARLLAAVRLRVGAVYVALLEAHDSGFPITPGTKIYVSAIHVSRGEDTHDPRDTWIRRRADAWYIGMLERTISKGQSHTTTADIPGGTGLKLTYERAGVKSAHVFHCLSTSNARGIYYIAICLPTDAGLSADGADDARAMAMDIGSLLAAHHPTAAGLLTPQDDP